ncbi:uncharacterized protein STEHIDRAFT_34859, partial [Stereum hirsutum FP-91666 SS1]|uniref:uncharacterized protein n=1 Tax=Stereum hirsutum (strain FP-91666) TaxID=721885 RepID=UPI000444A37D
DAEEDLEDDEQSEEEDLEDDEHEQERAMDDESDDGEVDEDREEYDEIEMEEMRELIEDELNLDRRVLKSPRLAIQRIKLIARRTHFSSTRRRALRQYCVQKKVPEKILPRAVVTRWTSLTNIIAVTLQICPAVALLTENPKHKLTHLALDEEQWTFLGHLYPIVDQFRRAIVHLEARNRPFLYEVIPGMDNLITFLEDKASDENLPIAIRAAAFNGLKIMKKYYALTDDSILPRCGIICHPGLKMVYFTRAGWSIDWIAA